MTTQEKIVGITIHFIVPLIGLLAYFIVKNRMGNDQVVKPPVIEIFLCFATYVMLLILVLSSLFWKSSGLASAGMVYLIVGAPVVMGVVSYRNYKNKELSVYHYWAYMAELLYIPIGFVIMVLLALFTELF